MATRFSRAHYEKVADTLRQMGWIVDAQGLNIWQHEKTIEKFVEMFQADNPNFRESTFKKRCRAL